MSIFNEVQQLEHLAVIGKSLIKYAVSIEPGIVFERKADWWMPDGDHNFVGFQFQWTNELSITISLFGKPQEQFKQDDLVIKKGMLNNSECRVTDENQLMAASVCIWRSHKLFHQGSDKNNGALLLADEVKTVDNNWLRPRPDGVATMNCGNPYLADTSIWYGEVRDFMKKNKIIDSSLIA
jgi:hypothetical protein